MNNWPLPSNGLGLYDSYFPDPGGLLLSIHSVSLGEKTKRGNFLPHSTAQLSHRTLLVIIF